MFPVNSSNIPSIRVIQTCIVFCPNDVDSLPEFMSTNCPNWGGGATAPPAPRPVRLLFHLFFIICLIGHHYYVYMFLIWYIPCFTVATFSHLSLPSPCTGPASILVIQYFRSCAMSSVSRYFFMSPCMLSLHLFLGRPLFLLPETSSRSDFAQM